MLKDKRILLVITGGIAAYKALDVIRQIKKKGGYVDCILTESGAKLVTPLSITALSGGKVYQDMFSLKDGEIDHIELSRKSDLVVVAPATANIMAKMAVGIADDLASTAFLACDKPIIIAPAMNFQMWEHPATQQNFATLLQRGVKAVGPEEGELACGEFGKGRMSLPEKIATAIENHFSASKPLAGYKAIVTSGPTRELIDPVRYISNHSSGKQGYAIADALADKGADVTLISGVVSIAPPENVNTVVVNTADEMLQACRNEKNVDIAVCTAAVADWKIKEASDCKIKKNEDMTPPVIELEANPDILADICSWEKRPKIVVGFAAETENVVENAESKLERKKCDVILANDVSSLKVFGKDENEIIFISKGKKENWDLMTKRDVAERLACYIEQKLQA